MSSQLHFVFASPGSRCRMENRVISASLSTQSLTFRPGGTPVSFEVTVTNGSDQFAAFQLEVLAAGAGRRPGPLWYRLSPEVAAADPPGGVTTFQIIIFDPPLTAFVGVVNLTVRISSPQLREERKLLVRLTVEPGSALTLLSMDLPVRRFQVYPRNPVDIPVRVQNLGPQPVDVVLRLTGLDPSWLISSAERRLLVYPGTQAETTFQCQPPAALQAPSQDYPFTVEAISRDGSSVHTEGSLEVLPIGFIEFTATPQQQTLPSPRGWLPNWRSNSASFQLLFKNTSNLRQQVNVQLQGRDQRKCHCEVVPKEAEVGSGETAKVFLEVRTKRPWLGLGKTLRLEVKTLLSDQRLGSTDPATQTLELQVMPVIPLWLLLALIAMLAALLWLLCRPEPIAHTDFVNSVRFSSNAVLVLSGSDDCTIRHWEVNGDHLKPREILTAAPSVTCNGKPLEPKGVLAVADKPVRTLRFDPVDEQQVAAGLENGVIQMWDVPTGKKQYELQDPSDLSNDRVFDLVFTKNSHSLFSGHGSGKVRVWERPSPNSHFQPAPAKVLNLNSRLNYQVRALALSQDDSILVSAGQYKNIILWARSRWEQSDSNSRPIRISVQVGSGQGQNDYIWGLAFVPGSPELLATSDSDGYITIWDLDKCQVIKTTRQPDEPVEQKCAVRDRWRAAERSVRSIVFSEDGRELVSAGDDGRVVVWPLTFQKQLDRQTAVNGQEIYTSPDKLNSIDLTKDTQGTTIVSGGDDFQVRLHRLR